LVLFLCLDVQNDIDGSIYSLPSPQLLHLTLLASLIITIKLSYNILKFHKYSIHAGTNLEYLDHAGTYMQAFLTYWKPLVQHQHVSTT
jgi:hypothetical protein